MKYTRNQHLLSVMVCFMAIGTTFAVHSSGHLSQISSEKESFEMMSNSLEDDELLSQEINFVPLGIPKNILGSFNCKDKPRISRFPFPNDCSKFIYCVAGTPYPGKCPIGKHFNPQTKRCDDIGKVKSCLPITPTGLTTPRPLVTIPLIPVTLPSLMQSVPATLKPLVPTNLSPLQGVATSIRPQQLVESKPTLLGGISATSSPSNLTTENPSTVETTTLKVSDLIKDYFMFALDCKSKHPCGLYPSTNGDCTSFYLCGENGTLITKHCHGGQMFDIKSLECREPSEAVCWAEPDSGRFVPSLKIQSSCTFYNKTPVVSYKNETDGGIILTSPVVTNLGTWLPWATCPPGYFIKGINVWRRLLQQGNVIDQAGLISIGFQCEKLSSGATAIIESVAPGAPHDGWPNFYSCQSNGGGAIAIGFRLNSQPDQGPWPNDNLATDNVQLICSCGPSPVFKPYDSIPGPQNGHRGIWTQEQICKPRQALCGMQAQMVDYRERVVGSYDNSGMHNLKMKCCPVPDPVETCVPKEEIRLIRRCENTLGIYPRRCDFETEIGYGYDSNRGGLKSINFYESIGFSLEDARETLKNRFSNELQSGNFSSGTNNSSSNSSSSYQAYMYDWKNSSNNTELWKQFGSANNGTVVSSKFYLEIGTKAEVYQVVGTCSHFIAQTSRLLLKIEQITSGARVQKYLDLL